MLLDDIKHISSTRRELRNFGLVIGIGFAVLGGIAYYRGHGYAPYLVAIGGILYALGIFMPRALLPFQKIWMGFAAIVGFLITRIILLIVFSVVITPVGVGRRLFGKSFLERRFKDGSRTYWRERSTHGFSKSDWEKQF